MSYRATQRLIWFTFGLGILVGMSLIILIDHFC